MIVGVVSGIIISFLCSKMFAYFEVQKLEIFF